MHLILEGRHWMLPTVQSMGNAFLRRFVSYIFKKPTAFDSSRRYRFCLAILIFDWQGILTFILERNIFVRCTSEYSVHIRDRSWYRRTWFLFAASLSPRVRSSIFLIRSLLGELGSVPLKTITNCKNRLNRSSSCLISGPLRRFLSILSIFIEDILKLDSR